MKPFSRSNPSPDYLALMSMYAQMHSEGFIRETGFNPEKTDPEHAFPGQSLHMWLKHIESLIGVTHAKTILDYGSGKGLQYAKEVLIAGRTLAPSIQSLWGVDEITCFDPGVPEFSTLPEESRDGVIATDVLEHVPESDVFWVVDELFAHAKKFVFASIPCYLASATLPDGRNAHITIRAPKWWLGVFQSAQSRRPNIAFSTVFLVPIPGQDGRKDVQFLHSFGKSKVDFTMLENAATV